MEAIMISGNAVVTREALFIALYKKVFPVLSRYVSRMGGSFEEAKDVFQDALIIYYEKTVASKDAANDNAYLFGIAKHLWLRRYRNSNRNVPFDPIGHELFEEEQGADPIAEKLMHYLEASGKKCIEMLKAFYYDKLPVQQLADLFGYRSVRSATVQKYKCLEKVRDQVKQKSLSYEDFLE